MCVCVRVPDLEITGSCELLGIEPKSWKNSQCFQLLSYLISPAQEAAVCRNGEVGASYAEETDSKVPEGDVRCISGNEKTAQLKEAFCVSPSVDWTNELRQDLYRLRSNWIC